MSILSKMKNSFQRSSFRRSFEIVLIIVAASLASPAFAINDASTIRSTRSDETDTTRMNSNLTTRDTDVVTDNSLSHSDRRFIEKAAQGAQNEVRLAQLAAERTGDVRIKFFAQQLVIDHQRMNNELAQIAESKGVALSLQDRPDHHFKSLSDKTGSEFDQRFVGSMVDDHDDTITLFEKAAKSNNTDIASFATSALTGLQAHLRQAKDLEASLKR